MDKKPSVFPTPEQMAASNEKAKLDAYESEKILMTNEVYVNAVSDEISNGHIAAIEAMKLRTESQLKLHEQVGTVKDVSLSENPPIKTKQEYEQSEMIKKTEEQMRLRDEQLRKNMEMIQTFQKQTNEISNKKNDYSNTVKPMSTNNENNYVPPVKPPVDTFYNESYGKNPSSIDSHIIELSQPNYNSPFDVIPLPSQGKLYKTKKSNVRTAFMTTADENILSSPNLLQSGEFLEILMNRKILEPELRYNDLHVGDRNAIMIWLRATGYGEMYPVTLLDEDGVAFETEINLNDLKTKNLGAEPDDEGLFDFQFPLSKAVIKFKLLTCGDIDYIEKQVTIDKENNIPVNKTNTYTLEKNIVEVNGNRDKAFIRDFVNSIRIRDAKELTNYIENIESGIDLNIEIGTPRGGSIKTFLPLNVKFFWPNL